LNEDESGARQAELARPRIVNSTVPVAGEAGGSGLFRCPRRPGRSNPAEVELIPPEQGSPQSANAEARQADASQEADTTEGVPGPSLLAGVSALAGATVLRPRN
jgi:hypothetical protein